MAFAEAIAHPHEKVLAMELLEGKVTGEFSMDFDKAQAEAMEARLRENGCFVEEEVPEAPVEEAPADEETPSDEADDDMEEDEQQGATDEEGEEEEEAPATDEEAPQEDAPVGEEAPAGEEVGEDDEPKEA